MKNLLLTIIIMGFSMVKSLAQTASVNVTGNWSSFIPSTSITEAGNNYNMNLTSLPNQAYLDIANTNTNASWTVSVSLQMPMSGGLELYIRKTGDGIGTTGGSIMPTGTNPYIQLSTMPQLFFQGVKNITNIPIQCEIRGLSVTAPASTYSTSVVYTITAL
jgi:hypothetical protein